MMHKNTPDEFTSMVLSSKSAMCIIQAFQNHALIKKKNCLFISIYTPDDAQKYSG